jgi:adenosylcobinamide-GDP ribazoletransferase
MARRQPPARADGLGARLGIPGPGAAALAAGLAAVLALLLIGWRCLPVLALAGAATYGLERLARRQLGGFTGDVLGAVQQLVEIVVLLTLVILP